MTSEQPKDNEINFSTNSKQPKTIFNYIYNHSVNLHLYKRPIMKKMSRTRPQRMHWITYWSFSGSNMSTGSNVVGAQLYEGLNKVYKRTNYFITNRIHFDTTGET